ncbi:MAG TPA: ATP-binding SpoIIE family protein phosphatase [Bryobacteraceae bacterium]|jgi:anti-sigma regulatory factor (Ser/Thr protein kinase)|nr:ATP-binding SpoIIE family protein phosphatase [Bryobacteraceae bacterium]
MRPAVMVPVNDATRVAEVRRLAVAAAQSEGLAEQGCEETAIIATEIATNLLKHAQSGEVHISALSGAGDAGVEILSIDRGPGMASLAACVQDGFSTSGTAGTGLGAISRLADIFDGFTQPGRGTVIVTRKFGRGHEKTSNWVFGAAKAPYPGETECGDDWALRRFGDAPCIVVADGLGHGILAADAASSAVDAFRKGAATSPAAILENIHLALRATRGAAVAVTCIEDHRVHYAGLGNISGVILGGRRPQFMVSHNGTAGLEARRFQEFEYPLPEDAAIVMHSDGLLTSWSTDAYPGLLRRHPSVIAGTLYRDASRGRDDVCVLAGRYIWE